jgi:hypothetical protein
MPFEDVGRSGGPISEQASRAAPSARTWTKDFAIGAPREGLGDTVDAGAAVVIYGDGTTRVLA